MQAKIADPRSFDRGGQGRLGHAAVPVSVLKVKPRGLCGLPRRAGPRGF
ncbi:MAG: hypothetical protein WKG07_14765 [Hymenobacter sp.]